MENKKISVIHQTDCFHGPADPDDHWDLACQFALAYADKIDLKGVLIDYPPRDKEPKLNCGDPAIAAVSQLNYMCGKHVPVAVGCKERMQKDEDIEKVLLQKPLNAGISMLIDTLESACEPVVIHIVGSARDIMVAATLRPDLFKEKCAGVYLNAGTAVGTRMEYNVLLDPYTYVKAFSLPCPLYWMPCFNTLEKRPETEGNGTFYKFCQGDVLPHLSENLQKYFAYALSRADSHRWLSYLEAPLPSDVLDTQCGLMRNMWCTAGFLHTAGYTVTVEGDIVPVGAENAVFDFVPINVTARDNGFVEWSECESSNRYIFKINDEEKYTAAMTRALEKMLSVIP